MDLAALWAPGEADQPWAFAFRMFRGTDAGKPRFGDISVRARSVDGGQPDRPNGGQDGLAAYAAQRGAGGALTVMVINKTGSALDAPLTVAGFDAAGPVRVWRYSDADLGAIAREADATLTGGAVTLTYPARSITMLVLPAR